MFLYENLFFSISSVISIPVMLIGINGGYFPAICRVCFFFLQLDAAVALCEIEIERVKAEASQREQCWSEQMEQQEIFHQQEIQEMTHQVEFLAQEYNNYQTWVSDMKFTNHMQYCIVADREGTLACRDIFISSCNKNTITYMCPQKYMRIF